MYTKKTIIWFGQVGANWTVLLLTLLLQMYKIKPIKAQPKLPTYLHAYTHYKVYFYR